MSSSAIINPKLCNYNCGTRIYWDTTSNSYLEVFTKQKHICKNRSANNNVGRSYTYVNKPNYYNKYSKQPKPKMCNSLEILQGPITDIQRRYEILSDIVSEANGKVHGSQSHIVNCCTYTHRLQFHLLTWVTLSSSARKCIKNRITNKI